MDNNPCPCNRCAVHDDPGGCLVLEALATCECGDVLPFDQPLRRDEDGEPVPHHCSSCRTDHGADLASGPCALHPAYFADYCPRCGTAQVIR